jgi:hypothetical protein
VRQAVRDELVSGSLRNRSECLLSTHSGLWVSDRLAPFLVIGDWLRRARKRAFVQPAIEFVCGLLSPGRRIGRLAISNAIEILTKVLVKVPQIFW